MFEMRDPARPRHSFVSTHEPQPRINVGFRRVTANDPCPICGRKKWCQVTRDGRLAHCMWESRGAIKRAKDEGYIHVLIHDALPTSTATIPRIILNNSSLSEIAPLEIRDAAYIKLLELSPAWKYERELITGERGLLSRGFSAEDVLRFGALPARAAERDALAQVISESLTDDLPSYVAQHRGAPVLGVPGFWEGRDGLPRLGRATNYKRPALVIPYRDRQGSIQACQLRFEGARGKSIYTWLSTSEERADEEPRGTSSGTPIHFAFREGKFMPDLPIIITEGALKAEAFVTLRPACRAVATAGVGVAHDAIIEATRGQDAVIAFDSDHQLNTQVCRQLAKLIAAREQDAALAECRTNTSVVVWDRAKGVDDAVLANLHLRVISIAEWYGTLKGKSLYEVKGVWASHSFSPACDSIG